MEQIQRTLRPDRAYLEKWDKTIDKVHWESNTLVKRHPDIDPAKIIPKGSTGDFPSEAITVRFHSQKRKNVGIYIYGKKKTRSWGSGSNATTHTSIDEKLKVDLPMKSRHNGQQYGFQFQGQLPLNFDLESLKMALDYITMTIDEIGCNGDVRL